MMTLKNVWIGLLFAATSTTLLTPAARGLIYLDDLHGEVALAQARSSYNPVAAVLGYDSSGNFLGHGSGSLITTPGAPGTSPNHWLLTAAHVVSGVDSINVYFGADFDSDDGPANYVAASDWYIPDSYDGNVISESDIALIRLSAPMPVATHSGYSIPTVHDPASRLGQIYHMAGFGTAGNGAEGQVINDGQKRTGRNMYELTLGLNNAIVMSDFDVDFERDELATTSIDEPNGEFRIARETSSAQGDSGGPQLSSDQIISITSFGQVPPLFNTVSGDVLTAPWAQWITDIINDVDNLGGDGSTVTSGLFGDGAKQGSSGSPIILFAGAGSTTTDSNYQYYSRLLIRHFDPDDPMDDHNDVLRLLGLSKRSETLTVTEAAAKLADYGYGGADTDQDAVLKFAHELLDDAYSGLPDDFTDLGGEELGYYGFLRGIAPAETFAQNPVSGGSLTPGDANGDGVVDMEDLEILAGSWLLEGDPDAQSDANDFIAGWTDGDFNGDDQVDQTDLNIIALHWTDDPNGPTFAEALATVGIPEPASLMLLGVGFTLLGLRRR